MRLRPGRTGVLGNFEHGGAHPENSEEKLTTASRCGEVGKGVRELALIAATIESTPGGDIGGRGKFPRSRNTHASRYSSPVRRILLHERPTRGWSRPAGVSLVTRRARTPNQPAR